MDIVDAENTALEQFMLDASVPLFRVRSAIRNSVDAIDVKCIGDVTPVGGDCIRLGGRLVLVLQADEEGSSLNQRHAANLLNGMGRVHVRNRRGALAGEFLDGIRTIADQSVVEEGALLDESAAGIGRIVEDIALVEDTCRSVDDHLVVSGAEGKAELGTEVAVRLVYM